MNTVTGADQDQQGLGIATGKGRHGRTWKGGKNAPKNPSRPASDGGISARRRSPAFYESGVDWRLGATGDRQTEEREKDDGRQREIVMDVSQSREFKDRV